jgi:hypothetical protein
MQVIISNKSRLTASPSRITVTNNNVIGRVTFEKVARVGSVSLGDLNNVDVTGQQDGDILVYQSNTNNYVVKTLPKVDGGTY